jgi:hypothetical protein
MVQNTFILVAQEYDQIRFDTSIFVLASPSIHDVDVLTTCILFTIIHFPMQKSKQGYDSEYTPKINFQIA